MLIPLLPQASTNYKEAFSLFDKRGNGRVALQSLGDLLRACGQNPTLAEIHDLEGSVGGDCMCPPSVAVARRDVEDSVDENGNNCRDCAVFKI